MSAVFDLNNRQELINATVSDLIKCLQTLPGDAKVFFAGDNQGFIHVYKDKNQVCIDESRLDYYYDEEVLK